jgi:hypothetical protein
MLKQVVHIVTTYIGNDDTPMDDGLSHLSALFVGYIRHRNSQAASKQNACLVCWVNLY